MKNYMNLFKTSCISGALALVSFSQVAQAQTLCSGKVDSLAIDGPSGSVLVSVGGLTRSRICSVASVMQSIPVESCKANYATLLAAKASGKPVTLWFAYGDATKRSCGDQSYFPQWSQPTTQMYYLEQN